MENKKVVIDEMTFELAQMPTLQALRLDKKVVTLLLPVFDGIGKVDLDADVAELAKMAKAFQGTLMKMEDKEWDSFILDMLSHVVYLPEGGEPQQINTDVLNKYFRGKLTTIYRLAFEVMKFNKFSPFELVEGGNVMKKILGSKKSGKDLKKTGNKLGRSGNLLET